MCEYGRTQKQPGEKQIGSKSRDKAESDLRVHVRHTMKGKKEMKDGR